MSLPFLVCAAITVVSSLVSLGYSVAALLGASAGEVALARYAASRSVALAAICAVPLMTGSAGQLALAAGAMTIVQALDALIGFRAGDPMKTWGPAATATANLAAVIWMLAAP